MFLQTLMFKFLCEHKNSSHRYIARSRIAWLCGNSTQLFLELFSKAVALFYNPTSAAWGIIDVSSNYVSHTIPHEFYILSYLILTKIPSKIKSK